MSRFAYVPLALALLLAALPLAACQCGQPSTMPAFVIRSPIGIQQETAPGQVRMVPAYSVPNWSAPAVAPQMPAPSFDPCNPTSSLNTFDPCEPSPVVKRQMRTVADACDP